jgi:dipeptidyl aminopeptidase/acylaminoacyl peptidase
MHARTRTTATTLLASALLATPVAIAPAYAAGPPAPALAFTSDRDGDPEIYLRSSDGSVRQLTHNTADDYGAVWSPDGRKLAFVSTRDGDREVFVMNSDGSGVRQLTRNSTAANGSPASDQSPAWSPKGHQIVFVSTRDGGEPEVYKMQADGRRQVRLTRTPVYVSNHTPSWAPDGKSIVFSSDRVGYDNYEVFRMRTDGGGSHPADAYRGGASTTTPPSTPPTAGASPSPAPAAVGSTTCSPCGRTAPPSAGWVGTLPSTTSSRTGPRTASGCCSRPSPGRKAGRARMSGSSARTVRAAAG